MPTDSARRRGAAESSTAHRGELSLCDEWLPAARRVAAWLPLAPAAALPPSAATSPATAAATKEAAAASSCTIYSMSKLCAVV